MKLNLYKYSQLLLAYTLFLILWGTWVRISHSGDGCGDTWPLCGGDFIPTEAPGKTWIEYIHRLTSGIYGLLVLHFSWMLYKTKASTKVKRLGIIALVLTITEGLFGAVLVKAGLVAKNDSALRGFVMGLHFLNSAALVASISFCGLNLRNNKEHKPLLEVLPQHWNVNIFKVWRFLLWTGLAVLGITGTWAALSTTLFPSSNLSESWQKEFQDQAHWVMKARSLHPVLALGIGSLFSFLAGFFASALKEGPAKTEIKKFSMLMAATLVVGLVTLFTLSPVVMKLVHLFMAQMIVIQATRISFELQR